MQTRTFVAAIVLVTTFVATTQLFGVDDSKETAQNDRAVSWEYCELQMLDQSNEAHLSFEGPMQSFSVVGFSEFADKLGMTTDATNSTAFLNHLGSQGWELVSNNYSSGRSGRRHIWLLKRHK